MTKTYNLYNLEAPFKEYLVAGNQKDVSIKNYLSDFRHFAGWVMSKGGHRGLLDTNHIWNQIIFLTRPSIVACQHYENSVLSVFPKDG